DRRIVARAGRAGGGAASVAARVRIRPGVAVGDLVAVAAAIARPVGAVAGVAVGDSGIILRPGFGAADQSQRRPGSRGGADSAKEGAAAGISRWLHGGPPSAERAPPRT